MSILTRNKIQTTVVRNKHIGWSLSARHTGTQGPYDGHRQPIKWHSLPVRWVSSAHFMG